jgi:Na+-transporting methylmalonyl-CoA/oxaloacetate decarboxylase beta subunit
MSVESEATQGRQTERPVPVPVPRVVVALYLLLAVALFGWFLFGWLVQGQGIVDSVGESAGTGFAILLIIAIVGTIRRGSG